MRKKRENGMAKESGMGDFPRKQFESVLLHSLRIMDQNREYLQMHLARTGDERTRQALEDMGQESIRLERTLREMMGSYLQIGAAAMLLLLGVSILLSRWATRPVERAWRQQRQFLSDASHELKTPLTVILSNAELLESAQLPERPARWTDNIRSEAGRMKSLVEEMLTLARADNMVRTAVLEEVSLSDLAADCTLSFEPVAFEAGKPLESDIAPDILVTGDADKRCLVAPLWSACLLYTSPSPRDTR